LSDISQARILQKCIQIPDIFSLFLLHKCLLPNCTIVKHFIDTYQANRNACAATHIRLKTDNWFIGLSLVIMVITTQLPRYFGLETLVKKSGFGLLFTAFVQQKIAKVLLIKQILKSKLKKSQITTKRLLRCTVSQNTA
jgi:hypothetical protein